MNSLPEHGVKFIGLVMAAGSLQAAMDEMIEAYRRTSGKAFEVVYGPSGSLRERIEEGAELEVFVSASLDHLEALAARRRLARPAIFARNELCVVQRSGLYVDGENLVDSLCSPAVRLATSTPGSDPMGDYTWQLFKKIDALHPGAFRLLEGKARKLSGARMPAAHERSPYLAAFEDDKADAYVMYRTNAIVLKRCLPQLQIVSIPDAYNVHFAYGVAAAMGDGNGGHFVDFVLSAGQEILARHGFARPE